jgi:hypothetical protein
MGIAARRELQCCRYIVDPRWPAPAPVTGVSQVQTALAKYMTRPVFARGFF